MEGSLLNWLARFHVLLVHFPIGLIFLVIALEILAKLRNSDMREAIIATLWLTLIGSIGTTILGFALMGAEDVAGKAMDLHMWTGLAVVVFSVLALIFKLSDSAFVYGATLALGAVSVSAAGHYGGAMVHEADYLAEYGPDIFKPLILAGLSDPDAPADGEKAHGSEDEVEEIPITDQLVYSNFVVPILEGKCNECHNENKIKGDLRMDTHELLMAGAKGSDFPTVVPGDSEESELIFRVELPEDDDDFMPPKGEPLTPEETRLLKYWIDAGATTEMTVAEIGTGAEILATFSTVAALYAGDASVPLPASEEEPPTSIWDTLSEAEQESRLFEARLAGDEMNISIMPISAEDPRLRINVLNGAAGFGDEQILRLEPVAERIVSLDLAKSQVTDEGLKIVGKMTSLEKLHLENTRVTDAGIAHLTSLKQLNYLNLYGTGVTNQLFKYLEALPNLKRLYVWQTGVDAAEARRYENRVNLQINTGFESSGAAELEVESTGEPKPEEAIDKDANPASGKPKTAAASP